MTSTLPGLQDHEVARVLERTRTAVDPELRRVVGRLPAGVRRVAEYHLGWRDRSGMPATGGSGKAIRPALLLAAARAVGGTGSAGGTGSGTGTGEQEAVGAAAAVELVHNFTLLHDDVMDEDPARRHRPTAWCVFGVADAVVAGDALLALAMGQLAQGRHPAAEEATMRLGACVIELCEGQHADCAFEDRSDVSLTECAVMAEAKTGALLGCACALGALYGGADPAVVCALDAFGREIGFAFQLIDDLLGIWGDPSVTGKPVGADLAARKKSLPVVAALTSATPAAAELADLYRRTQPLEPGDLARAAKLVEQAGGRDWAQTRAADHAASALEQLTRAIPDPRATDDLVTLAELVTRRER